MGILSTEEFPNMTYVGSCVSGNTFIQLIKRRNRILMTKKS